MKKRAFQVESTGEARAIVRKHTSFPSHPFGIRIPHEIARKLPFLRITAGKSKLVGVKIFVRNPIKVGTILSTGKKKGKPFFEKGERVLRIHLDSTNLTDIQKLFDCLEKNLGGLKSDGFSGLYGYTSNKGVIRILKSKFNQLEMERISTPKKEEAYERRNYRRKVKALGFSPKYLKEEIQGIAIRI